MPKIKTLKSATKRFKKIANRKFKHKHSNLRHILTKKSTKRKRHLRSKCIVDKSNLKFVSSFLPYS